MLWPFFLGIGLLGFAFLLVSAFGGDFDSDADLEFDADADLDLDGDFSEGAGDSDPAHSGRGSLLAGWLSVKVLSALAAGFGTTGLALTLLGLPLWAVIPCALLAGWIAGFCARQLYLLFVRSQSTSQTDDQSLIYRNGHVRETILPGRVGEIEVDGQFRPARCEDSDAHLPSGSPVTVLSVGDIFLVRGVPALDVSES